MEEVARTAFAMATRRCVVVVVSVYCRYLLISDSGVRLLGMPVPGVLECVYRAGQCKLER